LVLEALAAVRRAKGVPMPKRTLALTWLSALAAGTYADPGLERAERFSTVVSRTTSDPTAPRGFGGQFVTMRDEFENYPVDTSLGGTGIDAPPATFAGPPGFEWGTNNLRGQSSINFVRVVDLSGAPVGGSNGVVNGTKAVRLRTGTAQPANGFFTGANIRWAHTLQPAAGTNARVSAEHYLSTIQDLYTYETVSGFQGYLVDRIMWGGECIEDFPGDCTDIGLPIGLLRYFSVYRTPFVKFPEVRALRYCADLDGTPFPGCSPPPGVMIGDPVAPPIANWFRLATETTSDGVLLTYFDALDGFGEVLIQRRDLLAANTIDRLSWNASFEFQGAFMLIDNVEASGPLFQPPIPPALKCPYHDDIEWLLLGGLIGLTDRWTPALSSALVVVDDGPRGRVLRQRNDVSADNQYRREFTTELPASEADLTNDIVVSVDARTLGSAVRAFALFSAEELVARVTLGREIRFVGFPPFVDPSVLVQINPDFDPIDDPFGDPFDNTPAPGIDVEVTPYDWPKNQYVTIAMRVSANGALRVYMDGQQIYAGGAAFGESIDRFAFESENNVIAFGSTLYVENVAVACDAASCATDFDFDDATTFSDLNAVLSNFGASGLTGFHPGDANADGVVDFTDLNAVLAAFGTRCQ
jgi:hypothetical protein